MNYTLEQFQDYLKQRGYAESTIRNYSIHFDRYNHLFNREGKTMEDKIRGIEKFCKAKVSEGNPFYTGFLKAYLTAFKIPFEIPKRKGRPPDTTKKDKYLKKGQVDRMIEELPKYDEYYSLMVRLYFETGLRLRELIDLPDKGLSIKQRRVQGLGKNKKWFNEQFSETTKKKLKKWIKENPNSTGYPFHYRKAKDQARSFWYFLKKYCKEIGISNVHPHRLRHALGHHLRVNKGFDIQEIKVKLRHSHISSTEIYTDTSKEEVERKIDEEVFE